MIAATGPMSFCCDQSAPPNNPCIVERTTQSGFTSSIKANNSVSHSTRVKGPVQAKKKPYFSRSSPRFNPSPFANPCIRFSTSQRGSSVSMNSTRFTFGEANFPQTVCLTTLSIAAANQLSDFIACGCPEHRSPLSAGKSSSITHGGGSGVRLSTSCSDDGRHASGYVAEPSVRPVVTAEGASGMGLLLQNEIGTAKGIGFTVPGFDRAGPITALPKIVKLVCSFHGPLNIPC